MTQVEDITILVVKISQFANGIHRDLEHASFSKDYKYYLETLVEYNHDVDVILGLIEVCKRKCKTLYEQDVIQKAEEMFEKDRRFIPSFQN